MAITPVSSSDLFSLLNLQEQNTGKADGRKVPDRADLGSELVRTGRPDTQPVRPEDDALRPEDLGLYDGLSLRIRARLTIQEGDGVVSVKLAIRAHAERFTFDVKERVTELAGEIDDDDGEARVQVQRLAVNFKVTVDRRVGEILDEAGDTEAEIASATDRIVEETETEFRGLTERLTVFFNFSGVFRLGDSGLLDGLVVRGDSPETQPTEQVVDRDQAERASGPAGGAAPETAPVPGSGPGNLAGSLTVESTTVSVRAGSPSGAGSVSAPRAGEPQTPASIAEPAPETSPVVESPQSPDAPPSPFEPLLQLLDAFRQFVGDLQSLLEAFSAFRSNAPEQAEAVEPSRRAESDSDDGDDDDAVSATRVTYEARVRYESVEIESAGDFEQSA